MLEIDALYNALSVLLKFEEQLIDVLVGMFDQNYSLSTNSEQCLKFWIGSNRQELDQITKKGLLEKEAIIANNQYVIDLCRTSKVNFKNTRQAIDFLVNNFDSWHWSSSKTQLQSLLIIRYMAKNKYILKPQEKGGRHES